MFKSIFLPLIGVVAFITFVGLLSQGKLKFLTSTIESPPQVTQANTKPIKIGDMEINVEVAKTNDEKSKGLSNRTSLDEKSGMIFVFDQNSKPSFWMKDTLIALDLIWINDNKIIAINKNVKPEPNVSSRELKKYPAPSEIDYVLEVNSGFSDKFKVIPGQMLSGLEQL